MFGTPQQRLPLAVVMPGSGCYYPADPGSFDHFGDMEEDARHGSSSRNVRNDGHSIHCRPFLRPSPRDQWDLVATPSAAAPIDPMRDELV